MDRKYRIADLQILYFFGEFDERFLFPDAVCGSII